MRVRDVFKAVQSYFKHRMSHNDVIIADIGDESRNVVVGKNILVIGDLHIPYWVLAVIALLTAVSAAGGIFIISDRFHTTNLDLLPMESNFNVLITSFGLKDSETGAIASVDDGKVMATDLEDILIRNRDLSILTQKDIDFRVVDDVITGNTQADAARLANEHNADVVIFGYIVSGRQFTPEIYIDPILSGAEEVYTSTLNFTDYTEEDTAGVFGESINILFPFSDDVQRRNFTRNNLAPRYEALTKFMFGLVLVKSRIYPEAINMFKQAAGEEKAWIDSNDNEKGKELLYLWIGTAMNLKAWDSESDKFTCPVLELEGISDLDRFQDDQGIFTGDWLCAKAAYEIAIKKNSKFARAYIGLGNLWLAQASKKIQEDKDKGCTMYRSAVELYEKAQSESMKSIISAQVSIKTNFNLGLVWANIHRYDCEIAFEKAQGYFEKVINEAATSEVGVASSPRQFLPQHFEAMANYHIGLLYIHDGQYKLAINTFNRINEIVGDFRAEDDLWQNIRYNAYSQKGLAYYQLARKDCLIEYWNEALKWYRTVVSAKEEFNDLIVVGNAYYYLGKIYTQQKNYREAVTQFVNASNTIEQSNSTDTRIKQLSGLIQLNLGDTYLHLSKIEPNFATTFEIFRSYEKGFDLLEPFLRLEKLVGEEKDILAVAYCNTEKLYRKQGQDQKAELTAQRVAEFTKQLHGYERACINQTKVCL